MQIVLDPHIVRETDVALAEWRQGDVVLGERGFTFVVNPTGTLSAANIEDSDSSLKRWFDRCLSRLRVRREGAAPTRMRAATADVAGLVVVTQTCDIVRSCHSRPFLEVAPLVSVPEDVLREIRKGRRPAYAFIPGLADRLLVADLDRVMTVEKPVAATWERTTGCLTDQQAREFAQALARKRVRFAFPDDFVSLAGRLQNRLQDKHGKNSDEGRALRALREIRVRAAPSWNDDSVEITWV